MVRSKQEKIQRPPYEQLRKQFDRAQVVPFLGAGASFPDTQNQTSESLPDLPTGKQLAQRLAELVRLTETEVNPSNLIEVATYYAIWAGRALLEDELEKVFGNKQRPGSLHYFLAEVNAPLLIITTNYDTLIESAFRERHKAFHLIMTPINGEISSYQHNLFWWPPGATEPLIQNIKEFSPTPADVPVIYKLHGGFDPTGSWQESIITEDDYFTIGGRMYEGSLLPWYVGRRLNKSDLLFFGYSLRDIHVRHMLSQLRQQYKMHKDYLITRSVTDLDRARFRVLGLNIYDLSIAAFMDQLRRASPKQDPS